MRILFLSNWYPDPPDNGSKLRVLHLLRGLAQTHEVSLLSFTHKRPADEKTGPLQALCREVQTVPWQPYVPQSWRARLGLVSLTPRSLAATYVPEMAQRIRQTLANDCVDLVIASQLGTARYAGCFQDHPALFEEVEVGLFAEQAARGASLRQRLRQRLTWAKHRRYLARTLRRFRACTVVSAREQALVAQAVPGYGAIEVIPNCVDLAAYADVNETPVDHSLIFTGSFRYFANHEAMDWFIRAVYPQIQAQIPDVTLTITGDPAGKSLPPAANVTQTGIVDDIRPWIARAGCSVVPILSGGGTRLKILEALALRTPVVTTTKGAEGLAAAHDVHLLIADTPRAFAEAVLRLLQEPGLRARLAGAGYRLVQTQYDWRGQTPHLLELVERVAGAGRR
ncbi:MAG: glycosyl transferase family 1 [Chloroflexi bacterium]|nr:MAG: glycosyl transferase family 1 [Chloroflexota bacterium]